MTPKTYLDRLIKEFDSLVSSSSRDGQFRHKAHINHISDIGAAITPLGDTPLTPLAVIVCTGIGSLSVGGVKDGTVFPTRGQVVLVNAPWIKQGYTRQIGSLNGAEGGERTYVIPRVNGQVILGGTREINDWTGTPREETTESILNRAVEICPDLLNGQSMEEGMKALKACIVGEVVGFRPSRTDGVCLDGKMVKSEVDGQVVAEIHNYGHGGAGWQSCWGCAEDVVNLLGEMI